MWTGPGQLQAKAAVTGVGGTWLINTFWVPFGAGGALKYSLGRFVLVPVLHQ